MAKELPASFVPVVFGTRKSRMTAELRTQLDSGEWVLIPCVDSKERKAMQLAVLGYAKKAHKSAELQASTVETDFRVAARLV